MLLNAVAIVAATAVGEADVLVAAVDGPAGVVADAIVVAMAAADVVVTVAVGVEAGTRHIAQNSVAAREIAAFFLVRPAGRTHLEVKVLYTPGKGKC